MTVLETFTLAAQIAFYLTPLFIALATLGLAWWRFKIFRIREPAIRADLKVTSRDCSPSYNALNAVATLTNTSRVSVQISRLEWSIVVLSPYSDADVQNRIDEYARYLSVDDSVEFPWDVRYTLPQEDAGISLEPGESTALGMSLAIPDWIRSVEVIMEVDSPSGHEDVRLCWTARCPHDLNREA